jgi:acyl-CoA thioesterase I
MGTMPRLPPFLVLLATLLLPGLAPAEGTTACAMPPELLETGGALPATARAIADGSLRVVVAGSASVLGPGTSGPSAAWPARLESLLKARYPNLRVETVVRGARGLTAADTAALLEQELARAPVQLVLWQTGTVEAVRGLELDTMVETLNAGLERLQGAGVDAVLIDPQFSRFLRANAHVDPYRDAMRLVAAAHGVPLLRRYDLMRFWAESDQVDLERAPRSARTATTDKLHDCLARALAILLKQGLAEAQQTGLPR